MFILDVLLRYGSVTLLFLLGALAIRDGRRSKIGIHIFLVTYSVGAMLLTTVPAELRLPSPIHFFFRIADIGNIVFIWWLGLVMFDDTFRLKWWHWVVFVINFLILLPNRVIEVYGGTYFPPLTNYTLDIITVGIMGHLVYVALKGREDDLIEPRRRLRLFFVLALVVATLTALFAENLLMENQQGLLQTLRCAIIFPMALWGVLWLTEMHPEKVIFEPPKRNEPEVSKIDPRDQQLLTELIHAMEKERAFKAPGLTIRSLAEQLKAPEHRLRNLINTGLGYRNFSAFLNHYRISAIKKAFARPENSRIPVLTIALDHGYNSLAPFNRAFRAIEGRTPSQYRSELFSETE